LHSPVTGIDSLRILEEMSDEAKPEFSLDQISQAETDEEFGLPEFKEHFADTLTPAVLKDWTAEDFASIYLRFRPHLERHAKRFLENPSQVEEVVQDAFLYLMTALPELDSELGVLKFLKWKVKMLSIDVIRLSRARSVVALDSFENEFISEGNLSESIERAEDAAVVSLALSKLNPRHREVLVKSVYEERSASEMARELGLSENATRQLLLRAKRSFRVALVGEADVRGMKLTDILSLAARNSKRAAIRVSAFLALVGMGAGILSQFDVLQFQPEAARVVSMPARDNAPYLAPPAVANVEPKSSNDIQVFDETVLDRKTQIPSSQAAVDDVLSPPKSEAELASEDTAIPADADDAMMTALETVSAAWLGRVASTQTESAVNSEIVAGEVQVHSSSGFSAFVGLDPAAASSVGYVYLRLNAGDYVLTAVPQRILVSHEDRVDGGARIFIGAADLIVGDLDGALGHLSYDASRQLRLGIQISFDVSDSGEFEENVSMDLLELGES